MVRWRHRPGLGPRLGRRDAPALRLVSLVIARSATGDLVTVQGRLCRCDAQDFLKGDPAPMAAIEPEAVFVEVGLDVLSAKQSRRSLRKCRVHRPLEIVEQRE